MQKPSVVGHCSCHCKCEQCTRLKKRKQNAREEAAKEYKVCPGCHKNKPIKDDFGYRKSPSKKSETGFKLIPQSYCHKCR